MIKPQKLGTETTDNEVTDSSVDDEGEREVAGRLFGNDSETSDSDATSSKLTESLLSDSHRQSQAFLQNQGMSLHHLSQQQHPHQQNSHHSHRTPQIAKTHLIVESKPQNLMQPHFGNEEQDNQL